MTIPQPAATSSELAPIARLAKVNLRYGKVAALDNVTLDVPAGCMVGLIGPDGVGKSSLLSLVAGARRIQEGHVEVLDGDMSRASHRKAVGPRIAFMAQGLGKNLYPTLSVSENVDFFGRLFGHDRAERKRRIANLLESTGLAPFPDRPAGKLSGGMKQKLSLCCALIHDPDLLILDEPTTGVDPLSRRQFWELIDRIRAERPAMSVVVATAYMEEAARFSWLVAMDAGRVLDTGSPRELLERTGSPTLEEAFIALLPEEKRQGHQTVTIPPRVKDDQAPVAIEAHGLTQRFGDFVAVNHVDLRIERGEIFGFLGSNGCGKTTTMKMLTGLLPATEGKAWLLGKSVDAGDIDTRRRVGYMTQAFSLYGELTVRQNLELHAKLFGVPAEQRTGRIAEMLRRFELDAIGDTLPDALPLGQRQRLQLAVALIHKPEMLILDEPTSGVDPIARDAFWRILIELARRDKVTIFISTHFMNEAERCDRISLMHAGRVLVTDAPAMLVAKRGAASLDDAFIAYLEEASTEASAGPRTAQIPVHETTTAVSSASTLPTIASRRPLHARWFDLRRMFSYAQRETMEIRRDPIRATLALLGTVVLLIVFGYGISMDVENLTFAVLDRDGTATSRDYAINIAGSSSYFTERSPIVSYADLDRRMRGGKLDLAIEIPPRFARDLARGSPVQIAAWIDGAMPLRAETVRGYAQAIHADWLTKRTATSSMPRSTAKQASIEVRYRYNPGLRSPVAIVPAVIALLLIMIPAMLSALSVVREKELGSIVNFYVTPVTRLEFLLGKQLPYIAIAFVNFLLLTAVAIVVFRVPLKGDFLALAVATLVYVVVTTAIGLLISAFMRSQIAAIFGTSILTYLPATQFSGMIHPASSLQGIGQLIGQVFPTTYYTVASRGVFSKALDFDGIGPTFMPLLIAIPVLLALAAAFLRKQET